MIFGANNFDFFSPKISWSNWQIWWFKVCLYLVWRIESLDPLPKI